MICISLFMGKTLTGQTSLGYLDKLKYKYITPIIKDYLLIYSLFLSSGFFLITINKGSALR